MIRVAVAQPRLTYHDKAINLSELIDMVRRAAELAADVVVLPECPLVGWLSPATREAAEPVPGPYTDTLGGLALAHGIAIVSGVEERAGTDVFNAAVLVGRTGSILIHHRKIDELPIGRTMFASGDRLAVCQYLEMRMGVNICADNWGDVIVSTLALMGAKVVFTPCAWAIEPGREQANVDWLTNRYLALASKHDITFVAANSIGVVDHGPWAGRVLHGDSLVVGPDGVLAQGRRHEADLLVVDLPTSGLRQQRTAAPSSS